MSGALDDLLYRLRLKKRPRLHRTRAAVAESIPVRNKVVEWRKDESGEVSLTIPVDQKRHLRLLIRLMDLPDKRVVALDEVGSFAWERCDGETTFGELNQELTRQFRMTPREAEASLAEYFRILGRRGMVGFLVSESVKADAEESRNASRKARSGPKAKRRGR